MTALDSTVWDLETADAGELFRRPDFVRIAGYTRPDGTTAVTTDPKELIWRLNQADENVGHNTLGFDLLSLAYWHGADWVKLADRARDTLILSRLKDPPRSRDTGGSVDKYSLDAVADRFGVEGKVDDIKGLKKTWGGYDQIPVDDPAYRDYLRGDVAASNAVAKYLPMTDYGKREHRLASLAGSMTLSGMRVDLPLLEQKIREGQKRKAIALVTLNKKYGIPLADAKGHAYSSPLATLVGKEALIRALQACGVSHWPTTEKTGSIKAGREGMELILRHYGPLPGLQELCELVTIVTTIRTVFDTVKNHLVGDRVHARINMGQASGRWSVTAPGLTVLGKHGGRHLERAVFLPEEGHVFITCDLSQCDMRALAGHAQDPAYMALFQPGMDVHAEIATQVFGTPKRRQDAKAVGHGWNYGLGAKKMIENGMDAEMVNGFINGMKERFPRLMEWREEIRAQGKAGELLDNGWGRLMRCDPIRAYTQAPALMGQGSARDLISDCLLRLPDEIRPMLRAMVHDEVLLSVAIGDVESVGEVLRDAMTTTWRDVPILCDLSKPGRDWSVVSEK